jgi:protein subunit release factor A
MSRHEAVIVEIRAAEGGADAKDLVVDQTKIYLRLIGRRSL